MRKRVTWNHVILNLGKNRGLVRAKYKDGWGEGSVDRDRLAAACTEVEDEMEGRRGWDAVEVREVRRWMEG